MGRLGLATRCSLLSFAAFLLASDSELIKGPRAAGVFLLMEGDKYSFNLTAAGAACRSLSVSIATKAQMERALQSRLETCKFGWVAEQIAVVPRITADEKCGNGKTGVVPWNAKADKMFGVFCFNASDFEETPNGSTAGPPSSPVPPNPTLGSATEAPELTSLGAPTLLIQRTSSPPKPSSPLSPSSLSTLTPSEASTLGGVFSTPAGASSPLASGSETPRPTKPQLGNVPTALIVLAVVALFLMAASVMWCNKLNIPPFRSRAPQKDDVETEMWKQADRDVDRQSPRAGAEEEEEEEEEDGKYSSEVTLCATPDLTTNPSE